MNGNTYTLKDLIQLVQNGLTHQDGSPLREAYVSILRDVPPNGIEGLRTITQEEDDKLRSFFTDWFPRITPSENSLGRNTYMEVNLNIKGSTMEVSKDLTEDFTFGQNPVSNKFTARRAFLLLANIYHQLGSCVRYYFTYEKELYTDRNTPPLLAEPGYILDPTKGQFGQSGYIAESRLFGVCAQASWLDDNRDDFTCIDFLITSRFQTSNQLPEYIIRTEAVYDILKTYIDSGGLIIKKIKKDDPSHVKYCFATAPWGRWNKVTILKNGQEVKAVQDRQTPGSPPIEYCVGSPTGEDIV